MVSDDQLAASRPRRPHSTTLAHLATAAAEEGFDSAIVGDAETTVTGISLSSQRVIPGDLYAALPGARSHGIRYVAEARQRGAVAVLTDPDGRAELPPDLAALVVARPRGPLGRVSAEIYGRPAESLRMIGVTGTQGKTTTTRLAESALLHAGVRAAVIGTVGTRIGGEVVPTALTTPEAPDLHGLFARMREDGVAVCAMEVSSHALVLGRVDGVRFDLAVFVNLGRDHLDFHADLEDYYQAKATLFTPERCRRALICVDDDHGRRLAAETRVPVRTYSATGRDADWSATEIRLGADGSEFLVTDPAGTRVPCRVPIPGAFNVANALAAVAAAGELGYDVGAVATGLARTSGVPGRLQRVEAGQDFTVIVDYAHKPDAVRAALMALRPLCPGRLIVVLGAGGDRDLGKRALMGEAAAEAADLLIVTDDNPRSEDPATIRAALITGARGGHAEVREVGDRREAIREAFREARSGDIVLIAGKGHETGQEVAGVIHPFDDRVVALEELRA